ISVDDAALLLVEQKLATVAITPSSLQTAAELFGYEARFRIDPGDGRVAYVLAEGLPGTGPIFAVARRGAGRVGVSNIDEVQAALEVDGHYANTEAITRVLRSSTRVEFLNEEWFW